MFFTGHVFFHEENYSNSIAAYGKKENLRIID
jgi:hypothetical protein